MYTTDGEGIDAGTIKFTGESDAGGYVMTSFTKGDLLGTYTVKGINVTLTGAVTWEGEFIDDVSMKGEWIDEAAGAKGTWTATKSISVYRIPGSTKLVN